MAALTGYEPGISMRFPRILRWRQDKLAIEANTLESAQALLKIFQ